MSPEELRVPASGRQIEEEARRASFFLWGSELDMQLIYCIIYAVMKLHNYGQVDQATRIFAALGDRTRQRIVELLADGRETRVSDLVREFDSTRQTVTRHLDVLAAAAITRTEWRGRERYTSLAPDAFDPARDWLRRYDRFWDEKLAQLKTLIEAEKTR